MSDQITPSELHRAITTILEEVHRTTPHGVAPSDTSARLLSASHILMAALGTGLGECRKETPFAALRPVIDSNGTLKWCCSHDPEHCAS